MYLLHINIQPRSAQSTDLTSESRFSDSYPANNTIYMINHEC